MLCACIFCLQAPVSIQIGTEIIRLPLGSFLLRQHERYLPTCAPPTRISLRGFDHRSVQGTERSFPGSEDAGRAGGYRAARSVGYEQPGAPSGWEGTKQPGQRRMSLRSQSCPRRELIKQESASIQENVSGQESV